MRAVVVLAVLALPVLLPLAEATTTHACTPRTSFGLAQVLPCSVTALVKSRFLMRVYLESDDVGPVVLEALYTGGGPLRWHAIHWACGNVGVNVFCAGGIKVGEEFEGPWTFTARPAVVGPFGHGPGVRLEVDVD